MIKQTLALTCLMLSFSTNGAMISSNSSFGVDTITQDSSTGLNWLDVTITNGRSFVDISSKLVAGQEFAGYRFATSAEVQQLWKNFGILNGTAASFSKLDSQYDAFVQATNLLGNNLALFTFRPNYYFGTMGYTADSDSSGLVIYEGLYTYPGLTEVRYSYQATVDGSERLSEFGSYLVQTSEVPVPTAAWLMGTGLIGLVGLARRKK